MRAGDGNRTRVASLEDLYATESVFVERLVGGVLSSAKGSSTRRSGRLRYGPGTAPVRVRYACVGGTEAVREGPYGSPAGRLGRPHRAREAGPLNPARRVPMGQRRQRQRESELPSPLPSRPTGNQDPVNSQGEGVMGWQKPTPALAVGPLLAALLGLLSGTGGAATHLGVALGVCGRCELLAGRDLLSTSHFRTYLLIFRPACAALLSVELPGLRGGSDR